MSEQNTDQVYEIDEDKLQELFGSTESETLPPIEIPMEWYDEKEFHQGIKDTSHLAGVVTALLNTGVTEQFVLDYLLSKDTIAHNIEVAKINKEMNVEVAKNAKLAQEKFDL